MKRSHRKLIVRMVSFAINLSVDYEGTQGIGRFASIHLIAEKECLRQLRTKEVYQKLSFVTQGKQCFRTTVFGTRVFLY